VHLVQAAACEPMTDGPPSQTEFDELPASCDPVLSGRQRPDPCIRVQLGPNDVLKCTRVHRPPILAPQM
jgi:hypothetical protein